MAFPQLNFHRCKPKSGCENTRAQGASVFYHHLREGSLGPRPSTRSCIAQTCAYTTAAPTGFLMQLSQIWSEQTGTSPRCRQHREPAVAAALEDTGGAELTTAAEEWLAWAGRKIALSPWAKVTVTLFKSTTFASYL